MYDARRHVRTTATYDTERVLDLALHAGPVYARIHAEVHQGIVHHFCEPHHGLATVAVHSHRVAELSVPRLQERDGEEHVEDLLHLCWSGDLF